MQFVLGLGPSQKNSLVLQFSDESYTLVVADILRCMHASAKDALHRYDRLFTTEGQHCQMNVFYLLSLVCYIIYVVFFVY